MSHSTKHSVKMTSKEPGPEKCSNCGHPLDHPSPLPDVNSANTNRTKHKSGGNLGSDLTLLEEVKANFFPRGNPPVFRLKVPPFYLSQTGNSKSDPKAIAPIPFSDNKNPNDLQVIEYMVSVQKYINRLGYLLEGEPKIQIDTTKSIRHQVETAKQIIKAGEPIICHHALVLGIYFTNCFPDMERFTLSFRYKHEGKEYIHAVLGITFGGYANIGISRHPVLHELNRPNGFLHLSDLINEFKGAFKKLGQILLELKIGKFIPHDPHSLEHIDWGQYTLGSKQLENLKAADEIDEGMVESMWHTLFYRSYGHGERHFSKSNSK